MERSVKSPVGYPWPPQSLLVYFLPWGFRNPILLWLYILGVLITAIWTHGHIYGVVASLLSVVAFNYFFTVPQFTLQVSDPDYIVTFFVMLVASMISSTLAIRVKNRLANPLKKLIMQIADGGDQKLQQGKDEKGNYRDHLPGNWYPIGTPVLYALAKGKRICNFR